MMRNLAVLAAASLAAVATPALAVTYTQSQPQTAGGQTFNFAFNNVAAPTGPGTFTITARGDYSPGIAFESLTYNVEGLLTGSLNYDTAQNKTAFSFDDNLISSTFTLTLQQLQTLAANGVFNVQVVLDPNVNLFANTAYVQASFDYAANAAVPEPATWAMMLLGFGGVGYALRRRAKVSTRIRFA